MVRYSWIVPVLLALPALGCGEIQEVNAQEAEQEAVEQVGEARQALVRYCGSPTDCNNYAGCTCINGTCQPDGFGPIPEDCSAPPKRACTKGSDCRSSCACVGGYCQASGGGFTDYCAGPPPDAYESDNTSQAAKGYLGTPQTGHSFHQLGDVDWVVVYFAYAVQATFETYDLQGGADTILELYTYNTSTGAAGSLIASNDDRCTVWYDPSCLSSRIIRSVPAQSAFFLRVRNKNSEAYSAYNPYTPGYSLRIY